MSDQNQNGSSVLFSVFAVSQSCESDTVRLLQTKNNYVPEIG
jgi:hypothetical protein